MSLNEFDDVFAQYGGIDAQLLSIDLMEGHDFEYLSATLLRKIGFTHVEVTPGSGDQGVDILAQKEGVKYAIQCKRYSHDLGNKPVQEVHAGKSMYNCHVGAVITNQHFTAGAKELAKATGVLLWDREWIKTHLENMDVNIPVQETSSCGDEMLPAAVDVILETGQASVSMLQRRLKLGYARAARIVDEMEEKGIVGPFQGAKPRTILITKEQWDRQNGRSSYGSTTPYFKKSSPDLDPVFDYRPQDITVEIISSPKIVDKSFDEHDSCVVLESKELSLVQKAFRLLNRILLSFVSWFDLTGFFTVIGELSIGTPSKDWHFVYIFIFILFLPVTLSIWVLANKKGPSHVLNNWKFWLILFIITLVLFSFAQ